MEAALARLRAWFGLRFPTAGAPLRFFASPGRINLLGEHTDYTEGLCLPAAIDLRTRGAFQAVPDGAPDADRITLHSAGFPHPAVVELGRPAELPTDGWERYVASAVQVLTEHLSAEGRQLKGMRGCLESDIPVGSGLSSSAALELLVLEASSGVSGAPLARGTLVELGQRAEWR